MDPMENNNPFNDDNVSEQQNQPEGTDSAFRPTLFEVRKSWGFRRTTIARREFMEEVGDLTRSPPLVRRGRSRRTFQTPETSSETHTTGKHAQTARSVLDDLEWSAPSSPVSEDSKAASEASAGGSLDPSLWQDFGSAFHTAFSLLGGNEDLPMTMTDALAVPTTNTIEALNPEAVEETEFTDNADDMETEQPAVPDTVAGGEIHETVLISSQDDDSDEMTLLQIKEQLASSGRQGNSRARGGKGGRGKARGRARGRGRGRGKGKGRGRGRGRVGELPSVIVDDDDSNDDVILIGTTERQHLQEEKDDDISTPPEMEVSPAHFKVTLSPDQQLQSDCIILGSDLDQGAAVTDGQYDDAPEEMEEEKREKEHKIEDGFPHISDTQGYDSNALHCICHQKQNKRFMICCGSCQVWFHGDCVGINETQGRKIEGKGQYTCPPCTAKRQNQAEFESHPLPDPSISFSECLTLSPSHEEEERQEERQALKEFVVVVEPEHEKQAQVMKTETDPEPRVKTEMETDSCLPVCTGPGCSKQALPDSVYCGTDCILQHAAVTMKTLSGPKVPKSKGRAQRKAVTAKAQRAGRTSKRLAGKALDDAEEEMMKEEDGELEVATSSVDCSPSLTDVQSASIPSSNLNTTSAGNPSETVKAGSDAVSPSRQHPQDAPADTTVLAQPTVEDAASQSPNEEKEKESENSSMPKEQCGGARPSTPPTPEKCPVSASSQCPTNPAARHHETGALIVTKTTYVIPKKQLTVSKPLSSPVSASSSSQKPSPAPTLLNETRNLPVSPAPSAPSSRPSQPNNQVRQSIQRSLTSILFKRVCDCEDLEMSESEAAKLVASIEMEMFDIFRNTDSKYMNKYRTIMFNLKDPRNKGLLYRVVRGEISPFRLVRMSQKDMQATKVPEPPETQVKDGAAKVINLLKPEAVKVDLPSLNPSRPGRKSDKTEQKRSLPAPTAKPRASQPSQDTAVPDILSCMLKDTTSEHKAHIFDLKCRICTGRVMVGAQEQPVKKKLKLSVSKDKQEPSSKQSGQDDSPLRAPTGSPEMDSPPSLQMDLSSGLINDSPKLTIVESPASPTDSPASPTIESPASPIMESPASPTSDTPTANPPKRTYTPVVIPAVSTVTITRRDPRTAPSRFTATSSRTSSPSNINHNQTALVKQPSISQSAPPSSLPQPQTLPKSILMKPSSTTNPRLYGASTRTMTLQSPADGDTAQFLSKQDILWKGFINMLTVSKFATKTYLVSGSAENLKADLPETIQIGGRILPETVWDYVEKVRTSVSKELCVIRFQPATEEEEVAYVSLFSYFSSRGRFGVVANISQSIKDVYLVPLSAKESVPSILQPLEGPGFEKKRPNLLLGLAIVQKAKRPGMLPQEIEEKRPHVNMSRDPMWIPKPPVLYGSDKLEIFHPYDPETPGNTSPPGSLPRPGSPSDSSNSVTAPALLSAIRTTPCVSSVASASVESKPESNSAENPTSPSSNKTPLQTILKTLFGTKQSDSIDPTDGSSTKKAVSVKKIPMFSKASGSMVDPIVQQYGQKSKVKEIEEDENDFDRPYDPEEEYDPAHKTVIPKTTERLKTNESTLSSSVDDDIAYDPEDESIFEVIRGGATETKAAVLTQMSEHPPCPATTTTSTIAQSSTPAVVIPKLPTGTVVVSAATLSVQQRMLEELNKQIEEQKRQLKEQEEALRQQREAVGMFMAHFSVSDSLMSPPTKASPLSQLSSVRCAKLQTESKPSNTGDEANNLIETKDDSNVDSKMAASGADVNSKDEMNTATEQENVQVNCEEPEKYSSAGEIEDSDVAYDPEDESLFDEIQEDVFKGGSTKTIDAASKSGHCSSHKSVSPISFHSRKKRSSPKRRSRRDRDRHRSPSRKSQQRSRSHSRRHRDRDRHRRSERYRSKHGAKEPSDRQGHYRKDHSPRQHSRGRRRSPSSSRRKHSVSLSPKQGGPFPEVSHKNETAGVSSADAGVAGKYAECKTLSFPVTIKNDPDGQTVDCSLENSLDKHSHGLNVKTEISQPTKLDEKTISDPNKSGSDCLTLENKTSLQEKFYQDKCENTIPLREIDPPIRDSPESPDPDPQFMKPCSLETSDCTKTEEFRNVKDHTCAPMVLPKPENSSVPIGGQVAMYNCSEAQQISCVKAHFIKMESGNTALKNQESMVPKEEHSKQPIGLHSEHVVSCPDYRDRRPDMTKSRDRGTLEDLKGTGRFPVSELRDGSMQDKMPSILGSGPSNRDDFIDTQGKHISEPNACMHDGPYPNMRQKLIPGVLNSSALESSMQNERGKPFMKSPLSLTPVPDSSIAGLSDPLPSIYQVNTRIMGCGNERQQNSNSEGNSDSKLEARVTQPESFRSHIRGRDEAHSSPFSVGVRGDQTQPWQDHSSFQERFLGKGDFRTHGQNADLSMRAVGGINEDMPDVTNPDWKGPGTPHNSTNDYKDPNWNIQRSHIGNVWDGPERSRRDPPRDEQFIKNDWSHHQSHRRGPHTENQVIDNEGIRNLHYRQPEPEINLANVHDCREPGGIDYNVAGPGRRGPEIQFQRHDIKPDYIGQGPERPVGEMEGQGQNMGTEVSMHDRRGPRGLDVMGQRSERPSPSLVSGPESMGPGFDGEYMTMEGQEQNRTRCVPPHLRGLGPDRKSPSIRNHRSDMMGPEFLAPCPERRGPNMEGPGPVNRISGNLELRRPGYQRENAHMQSPCPQSKGPGGPISREPIHENQSLFMEGFMPNNMGTIGQDFSEPERRGPPMGHPKTDGELFAVSEFDGCVNDMTGPTTESRDPERKGFRGPDFWEPGSEWRGPRDQNNDGHGHDRNEPYLGVTGWNLIGQKPERNVPGIEGPGPHDRKGGPHSGNEGMEDGNPNIVYGHNRKGPDFGGQSSDIPGPVLSRRGRGSRGGRGGPRMGGPWPQHVLSNKDSPGFHGPEGLNIRASGRKTTNANTEGTESQGPSLEMEGQQSDMSGAHFKGVVPEQRVIGSQWPIKKGPRGFRNPDNEGRGPDFDSINFHRQRPAGSNFREPAPERQCPDIESPGPGWGGESGDPDSRSSGIRQQDPNLEVSGHERQNDWGKPMPIQENVDLEALGSDRTSRNFRAPRPARRNFRRPRPNVWDSAPCASGTDSEQGVDREGPYIEPIGNEGECSGDNWDRHSNWSLGPNQDDAEEYRKKHGRQGPRSEWRNSGSGAPWLTKHRQKMQFPGPQSGPVDERINPGCRGVENLQENSDVMPTGSNWGEEENAWSESDSGSTGPFFRDERNPDNRGRSYHRGRGRGRVSDTPSNEWRQHDFRVDKRGPNSNRSGSYMTDPDFNNFSSDYREVEMEGLDRKGPGGPHLRHPEQRYPNSNMESAGPDGRFSDYGEHRSERHGLAIEDPGLHRQGFEQDFRRPWRGSKVKRQGPSKLNMWMTSSQSLDFENEPAMWDTHSEFPDSNRGGPGMGESEEGQMGHTNSRGRRGPHQVSRFQDSCEPRSVPFNASLGPGTIRGGKSFGGPQNPNAVQPPRQRGGLLPTPTEGLLPLPNHMMKNSELFGMEGTQMGHSKNWNPSRGRAGNNRHRGRSRGRGWGNPPGNLSTVGGEV